MKPLTKPVILISAFFILMMAAACKKDSDKNNDKAAIVIEGFKMKDVAGNDFGRYGPEDNDWTFKNTLNAREMALFDFVPAGVNLNNTVETAISDYSLMPSPNPCTYDQYFQLSLADSVLVKVVVVNNKLDVLQRTAVKGKGYLGFRLFYGDTLQFPDKSSLRVYYSFSAQNKENYKTGYGDIKICRGGIYGVVSSCFP
ncbi:hypothetical protein A4H97_13655 [Niastella yeongjuensis]|uniref:Uncharacterized protein n=1 Tax=Niastella yeongjuensis TaxID=354355 RepID=A0A1V9EAN3_9BACT|nr:hypothetical protein [Niastella yeongjuensis]OQP43173.1 hypothetical protein A4H97_13655 [Niastella yeongjuensis]SEO69320.1 hypothetical protein SAMN05660816_03400 [Niastella yeongjuensis]